GLDHVVIRTARPAVLEAFYTRVLGARVERRVASIGLVQLRAGASLIDILAIPSKAAVAPEGRASIRNMDHLCLRIAPFDEQAIRIHLAHHGVEAGAVARRYGAEGMGPSLYLVDPDGNIVELKGPPDG
ncbi:MAG: VOC family protein, partial [Alphaproteobacteria bacterium]